MLTAIEFLEKVIRSDDLPPVGLEELSEPQLDTIAQIMRLYANYKTDEIYTDSMTIIQSFRKAQAKQKRDSDLLDECLKRIDSID